MAWERLCSTAEITDGEIRKVATSNGSPVIALRTGAGAIKVFQGQCPHQKRSLADGYLDGTILTCSAHMWQFDVETGAGINAARCGLSSYPVRIEEGEVQIDISDVEPLTLWR